jgi:hypothetical protein
MTEIAKDFFRNSILRKSLKQYHELSIHDGTLNQKFGFLARELNKKYILDTTENMLTNLYKLHNYNPLKKMNVKVFLSCIMINHHPKVLLSEESPIEIKVQKQSNYLFNLLDDIYTSKNNFALRFHSHIFIKTLNQFIVLFDEWKKHDQMKIINDLQTIYFELETDKIKRQADNNPNQEVFIKDISREQKKIIEKIRQTGGQEAVDNFEMVKLSMEKYKESIDKNYDTINNIIHTAFWDNIKEQLSKDPPNIMVIIPLLEDVKKMLKACVPQRGDLHNQLDCNIDVKHIKNMIENNAIDHYFIKTIVCYIFNFIEKFQSSSKDKETEQIKTDLLHKFDNGMYYKDFFPEFFKIAFEKIEEILQDMDELKSSEFYDNIKTMYKNHKKK